MPSCFVVIILVPVISVELLVGFVLFFHLHSKLQQQIARGMSGLWNQ